MRNSSILSLSAIAIGVLAACGDSAEPTTASSTTASNTTASTTTSAGGSGGSGGEATTTTTTAGGAGGEATTTAAAGGAGGEGTGSGGTGGSAPEETINGCKLSEAVEIMNTKLVNMTPMGKAWTIPYQNCVKVKAGSAVQWTGNFVAHPLKGGTVSGGSGKVDPMNPISKAVASGGMVSVTVGDAGTHPFYCTNHPGTMMGVVYVMP